VPCFKGVKNKLRGEIRGKAGLTNSRKRGSYHSIKKKRGEFLKDGSLLRGGILSHSTDVKKRGVKGPSTVWSQKEAT